MQNLNRSAQQHIQFSRKIRKRLSTRTINSEWTNISLIVQSHNKDDTEKFIKPAEYLQRINESRQQTTKQSAQPD